MASRFTTGALLAAAIVLVPLSATGSEKTGRYQLHQTPDGFMRLDTQTGSIAHCRQKSGTWQCDDLATSAGADQAEVTALREKNRQLEMRITRLEAKLRSRVEKQRNGESELRLPSDQEFDQIMGFFEKFITRFMEFARTLNEPHGKDI